MTMKIIAAALLTTAGFATGADAHLVGLPSYWCSFTEPFITVSTSQDAVSFENFDKHMGLVKITSSKTTATTFEVTGALKSNETFTLKATKGKGSDGMSDISYPYVGELTEGMKVNGGCVRLADKTSLRKVVGVAENDVLNVRRSPNSKSKIVSTVYAKGKVWLKSGKAVKGWVPVSVLLQPKSEQGTYGTVSGWVNSKFIAKP